MAIIGVTPYLKQPIGDMKNNKLKMRLNRQTRNLRKRQSKQKGNGTDGKAQRKIMKTKLRI